MRVALPVLSIGKSGVQSLWWELVRKATVAPKKRVKTRVSLNQKRKRVAARKKRGEVKALRGGVREGH